MLIVKVVILHEPKIFDEVLATKNTLYLNGDYRIGIKLYRMGSKYLKTYTTVRSFKYFEDSLQILQQHLSPDHYEIRLAK